MLQHSITAVQAWSASVWQYDSSHVSLLMLVFLGSCRAIHTQGLTPASYL